MQSDPNPSKPYQLGALTHKGIPAKLALIGVVVLIIFAFVAGWLPPAG